MEEKFNKIQYPALSQYLKTASEEVLGELMRLTGTFDMAPTNNTNELNYLNGRRSIGLALLKIKEEDLNKVLVKTHKELTKAWKTKQNLQ